ncbi:unnamed protein product [Mytilus edulis]|uniref:Uncharacterized protein n=1 Tax=Mytilus edulis TaxID=6550 RepID=A0A8S3UZA9_MYTED|nr:unnamed protein product [Mytilus edulis]
MADVQQTNDSKQVTFDLTKRSLLFWRRILLLRYYVETGKKNEMNVVWADYDKKTRLLALNDETKSFSEKSPDINLFKSVVQISRSSVKLLTINIYYTTFKCLVQGNVCQRWVTREFDYIKKQVNMALKGDNPKAFDLRIRNMRPPNFTMQENLDSSVDDNDQSNDALDETLNKSNDEDNTDPKKLLNTSLTCSDSQDKSTLSESPTKDTSQSKKNKCDTNGNVKEDQNTENKQITTLISVIHSFESKYVENQMNNNKIIDNLVNVVQKMGERVEILEGRIPQVTTDLNPIISKELLEKAMSGKQEMMKIDRKLDTIMSEVKQIQLTQKNNIQITENITSAVNENFNKIKTNVYEKEDFVTLKLDSLEGMCKEIHCIVKENNTHDEEIQQNQIHVHVDKNDHNKRNHNAHTSENHVKQDTSRVKSKNESKRDEKRLNSKENNNEVKFWLVGSSIVKDMNAKKIFRYQSAKITTLRDKTIKGAIEFLETGKLKADNIAYQVGSNDLDEKSAEEVVNDMKKLVLATQRLVPGSNIIINELLPRYYKNYKHTEDYEVKRLDCNALLEKLCSEFNLKFVHHRNLTQINFSDGIHLDVYAGIGIYVRNLKSIVSPLLGVVNPQYTESRQSNWRNQQHERHYTFNRNPWDNHHDHSSQWQDKFTNNNFNDYQQTSRRNSDMNLKLLRLALEGLHY